MDIKKRNIVVTLVVLLAIGFASVSSTLIIRGLLAIGENKDDFKIIFTSATLDGVEKNDVISESKTEISYESKVLSLVNEESTLVYEATNTSRNYDANVSIVCNIVDESENIIEGENEYVDITYTPESMELLAGETKSGSITAKLKKTVTEPMDIHIKCTLNGTPKERDELGEEYIEPIKFGGTLKQHYNFYHTEFWQYRKNITKVVFENKLIEHDTSDDLIFDVSEEKNGSVMSYLVPNENDASMYTLYINSDGVVVANKNSSYLFQEFSELLEIQNLKYFDTSKVTDMSYMFTGCNKLNSLDLSNYDTSNVINMEGLFRYCKSLTNLNLSNFNTEKLNNVHIMFEGCNALKMLNISSFDMTKVSKHGSAFNGMPFYPWAVMVIVKDEENQAWVLKEACSYTNYKWSTENVVISS